MVLKVSSRGVAPFNSCFSDNGCFSWTKASMHFHILEKFSCEEPGEMKRVHLSHSLEYSGGNPGVCLGPSRLPYEFRIILMVMLQVAWDTVHSVCPVCLHVTVMMVNIFCRRVSDVED